MKTEFRLHVSYDPPPIACWREMCWQCIDDNTYDGAPDAGLASYVGIGSTPYAAIRDFLIHLQDFGNEVFAPGESEPPVRSMGRMMDDLDEEPEDCR